MSKAAPKQAPKLDLGTKEDHTRMASDAEDNIEVEEEVVVIEVDPGRTFTKFPNLSIEVCTHLCRRRPDQDISKLPLRYQQPSSLRKAWLGSF